VLYAAQKTISARQFAACPEFCVCRSRSCKCSGTPRPAGCLAGIRMAYLRRWALLPSVDVSGRRSPGCERILRFTALAFPMAQDAVDDPRVCNKRDDLHAGATGADQRVHFEDFPEQARPRAPGFPGEVGIVPLRGCVCCNCQSESQIADRTQCIRDVLADRQPALPRGSSRRDPRLEWSSPLPYRARR
jgi:hypothetical protein